MRTSESAGSPKACTATRATCSRRLSFSSSGRSSNDGTRPVSSGGGTARLRARCGDRGAHLLAEQLGLRLAHGGIETRQYLVAHFAIDQQARLELEHGL